MAKLEKNQRVFSKNSEFLYESEVIMNGKQTKNIDYRTTAAPKATTNDGIPVFCAHDDIIPIKRVKPNPLNPNHHPEDQIQLLGDIIERTGWRQSITISNQSGLVVRGHGRYLAALAKGWCNVPVDYQDYSNQDEEYADLIADNRLAELSEIQNDTMAELLQSFEDPTLLNLTGYDFEDIDEILNSLVEDEEDEEEPEEEKKVPETNLTKAGDTWNLGEHRLIVGEDDPFMDDVISTYVYETGNLGVTCVRDGKEYGYMELVSAWAAENNMTEELFKLRKPVLKHK